MPDLEYRVENGVGTILLNRPESFVANHTLLAHREEGVGEGLPEGYHSDELAENKR
jgi:hypothetical protein